MEVKKAIKKVIALGTGASMLGATLLGAMAADLANYPSPFVKDGKFDAFIVIGQDAQPEDVVGAVDIGASLQFEMRKATTISTGRAPEAAITEGYKVQRTTTKNGFYYGKSIRAVKNSSISEDELPQILSEGVYRETKGSNENDETYTQELIFEPNNAVLQFGQDEDYMPEAGAYLYIDESALYTYNLEFDDYIKYDNSSEEAVKKDIESTTIKIQGQVYTITDVKVNNNGNELNKITMLAGETVLWLQQDQPITKTVNGVDHTVTVVDVTEDESACLIKVDDTQLLMEVGDTETINGVEIGVTDARAIHAQLQDTDICQVNVGATKIVLEDGEPVINNGDEVEDSEVTINGEPGKWSGFSIKYEPDDEAYLASGKAWTDPVFNNWKIVFGGMSEVFEEIKATAKGSNGKLVFTTNDNKKAEIPLYRNKNSGNVFFGNGDNKKVLFDVAGFNVCEPNVNKSESVEDCENNYIFAVSDEQPHLLKIKSIDYDGDKSKITFEDLIYGKTYSDRTINATGIDYTIPNLGSINLVLNMNQTTLKVVSAGSTDEIETSKEAKIKLVPNTGNVSVTIKEKEDDINTTAKITLTFSNDVDDKEMKVEVENVTEKLYEADKEENSDIKVIVTPKGTQIWYDDEDDDEVTIKTSDSDSYGNVFIAPIAAEVQEAAGGLVAYEINKINVGASRLDTEISSVSSDNLIVVGGPCVNRVAAQVMGKSYKSCGADSGIPENAAMIKLFTQSSGKVSLVVAGWNAADTRRATRVLSDATLRKGMSGTAVKVTGTSWTDIKVSQME